MRKDEISSLPGDKRGNGDSPDPGRTANPRGVAESEHTAVKRLDRFGGFVADRDVRTAVSVDIVDDDVIVGSDGDVSQPFGVAPESGAAPTIGKPNSDSGHSYRLTKKQANYRRVPRVGTGYGFIIGDRKMESVGFSGKGIKK